MQAKQRNPAVENMHNAILDSFPATARIVDVRTLKSLDLAEIYAAVAEETRRILALDLRSRGPVVIGHDTALSTLVSLFACWQAGFPAVVVNPNLAAQEQANVVAHTGAVAWFGPVRAELSFAGVDANNAKQVCRGSDRSGPLGRDDAALILMTSGTTGVPKGIIHTIRNLEARLALNVMAIGTQVLSRSLCVLPAFFGHGLIGNCLTPLAAGGTLYLWNSPNLAEISALGEVIDQHEISFMSSVPSFWKLAMRMGEPPRAPLQQLNIGSAPLGHDLWQQIAKWNGTQNVCNMFGMTETANWIGGGMLAEASGRDGFVGKIWGGKLAVLTDDGSVRETGRGEVLIQSPSMMVAYLNAPEKTGEAFHRGWFRSGDIGELSPGGALQLVGRIKSEINRGGIKILAEEIDMLLERHPDIIEACAFGLPDAASGEMVGAAIVIAQGSEIEVRSIIAWCRDHVRPEAVPSKLFVLNEIPKNDRGKIVRADVVRAVETIDVG